MTPRHPDGLPIGWTRLPEQLEEGDVLLVRVFRQTYRLRVEEVGAVTPAYGRRWVDLQVRQLGPPGSRRDGSVHRLPVACGVPVTLEHEP